MFATLLKALSDSLISSLFEFLKAEMHDRGLIAQGQAQQAAAETAHEARTEASMAQAISDAPKSKGDALARLEAGSA